MLENIQIDKDSQEYYTWNNALIQNHKITSELVDYLCTREDFETKPGATLCDHLITYCSLESTNETSKLSKNILKLQETVKETAANESTAFNEIIESIEANKDEWNFKLLKTADLTQDLANYLSRTHENLSRSCLSDHLIEYCKEATKKGDAILSLEDLKEIQDPISQKKSFNEVLKSIPGKKLNKKSEQLFAKGKEFTSKQKDNTEETRINQYIHDDRNLNHLLNLTNFPLTLSSTIKQSVSNDIATIECTNLTLPHIHNPSTERMEEIAAHYKNKYGINITVCCLEKLTDTIKLIYKSETTEAQGVIVWDDTTRHVVPLIFHKHEGRIKIMNLDVLGGSSSHHLTNEVNSKLEGLKFDWTLICAPGIRQADSSSCRTGALVLLRDALNDLKYHNYPCLKEYLEPCTNDFRSCWKFIVTKKLPDTWVYGEQIFKADKSTNSPIKNKKITVSTFRNAYRKEVEKRVTLSLEINNLKTKPTPEEIAEWNQTEDLSVKVTEDELIISGIIRVQHNVYLALKGLKYGKLIT